MAFTKNQAYMVGTGSPNSDAAIDDGGGNIPLLYVQSDTDPVTIWKYDSSQAVGSRWLPLSAKEDFTTVFTDASGSNVGANCAVAATWYDLSISSAATKTHAGNAAVQSEDTSDAITFNNNADTYKQVTLMGQLDTSLLTVDTGAIKIRARVGETAVTGAEVHVTDDSGGVLQIVMSFALEIGNADSLDFQIQSTSGTGAVAFDQFYLSII